ncbi:site-specific integrase [Rhodococcus qingshengii]|uniref:site-specific integrase n=1 Tax=Rhodococcus qingshengii TaxID=334542 RepID=UPI001C5D20A2|nr:site-specific integrase [Rhodococcus qingshengii]MBW4813452.1 site-specific integrase [Rhodococcus qingshengii]
MAGLGAIRKRCGCRDEDGNQLGTRCPQLKRKNGGWSATHGLFSWHLGVTDPTGKRRQLSRSGYATKEDAQDALDKVRQQYAQGIIVTDRQTLATYLDDWMVQKRGHLKAGTISQYEGLIARVIVPHLGSIKIDELRPAHIRRAFDAYLADTTRAKTRAGGLTTIQRCKAVLGSALGDAEREGLVERNVARLVKLPSAPSSKAVVWSKSIEARWRAEVDRLIEEDGITRKAAREKAPRPSGVMVWGPRHVGAFLDHTADHRNYALWYLLLTRGLRRGEVTGLQWSDIDWEYSTLTVARQRIILDSRVVVETPKSESGKRTIALGVEGVEVLKAHRTAQAKARLAAGVGSTDWIFTDPAGQPLNPAHVAGEFSQLIRKADLPPIRTHDTRHTAATLALASGSDLVTTRDQLGHSNLKVTSRYLSMLEEVAQTGADNVAAFIPRAR